MMWLLVICCRCVIVLGGVVRWIDSVFVEEVSLIMWFLGMVMWVCVGLKLMLNLWV